MNTGLTGKDTMNWFEELRSHSQTLHHANKITGPPQPFQSWPVEVHDLPPAVQSPLSQGPLPSSHAPFGNFSLWLNCRLAISSSKTLPSESYAYQNPIHPVGPASISL